MPSKTHILNRHFAGPRPGTLSYPVALQAASRAGRPETLTSALWTLDLEGGKTMGKPEENLRKTIGQP